MAKTAKTASKESVKKAGAKKESATAPRRLKAPKYRSFRLQKIIKPQSRLPSAWRLLHTAFSTLKGNWKVFAGIVLVYGVLTSILVQSFGAVGSFGDVKKAVDEAFAGSASKLVTGLTLFAYLLGASGNTSNPTAGAYQMMLTLVVSLALIWTLRQVYAKQPVRLRDSFYLGMYPLVPFVLVLLVIALQLLPLILGVLMYGMVTSNGIAATGIEQLLWAVAAFLLALASLYMVTSSIFALYIACLPNMTPIRALKAARQLVAHRRWAALRKIVYLPIALLVLAAFVVIPLIFFATPLAPWAFFVLSMLLIVIVHSYMYALYRALL
ncbi:MAG TPA: hypothetical protein VJ836_00900 [Candidatus Saccharimonadales bacterium]|nr:hypothetical protein [Candidatus Saccharimonadales bacterium]